MLVGYQGIKGSFSNQAANEFVDKMKIEDAKLIPLIDSKTVVDYLIDGNIDYGILAIKNSTAGTVAETEKALSNQSVKCLAYLDLNVIHCLFKKKNINKEILNKVASHEQALAQTKNTREKYFANLEEITYADTALAAKDLANNILDETNAVICSKIAGELFDLDLIYEGLNDNLDNTTTFGIFIKE